MYVRPEIADMDGYVPGEQPQAGKFIKLNTNENPYPPSDAVIRAIADAAQTNLTRYPDPLATAFRLQASQVLDVDPDWILCGNGSDDLLTICTRAFVGQGELMRLPYPSYVLYRTLANIQGARAQQVAFSDDWELGADFVQADPQLRLAFLPNPNSPTGTMIPPQRVLEIARALPCPLLVDEAYVEFADAHCVDLVQECDKIMVSRSLSKSFGLAGLRFGYLVAQPQVIQQLLKVKDSYNCDALSIAGATAAIGDQEWLATNVARVRESRDQLTAELRGMGFDVIPSQANFVWCTHPDQPLQPVYEQLKSNRILVRYMKYPDWGDGIRVSVGTEDQIAALVAVLRTIL